MSGSVSGTSLMTSNTIDAFNVNLQKAPLSSHPPLVQNMRLAYSAEGTAVYKPVTTTPHTTSASAAGGRTGEGSLGGSPVPPLAINVNAGSGSESEPIKRKRGRPRKYGPDGTFALALAPASHSVVGAATPPSGRTFSSPAAAASAPDGVGAHTPIPSEPGEPISQNSTKKARGRPPGSSKKQRPQALGSSGAGFTPHVISVQPGEDVSSKIMSSFQYGARAICVLSANGSISNVTIRQSATSGGTVTYEGRFEILSLYGSFMPSENGGQRSRTGGLSVSLAGPDGRVLGGCVAGLLVAASPIQVVVGSFIAGGGNESLKSANQVDPLSAMGRVATASPTGCGFTGAASPPSRGTLSESSGGAGSPVNHNNTGSTPQGIASMPWK